MAANGWIWSLRPSVAVLLQGVLCSFEHATVLSILALKHQGMPLLLFCTSCKICIGEMHALWGCELEKSPLERWHLACRWST